jgi:hypothetical protein
VAYFNFQNLFWGTIPRVSVRISLPPVFFTNHPVIRHYAFWATDSVVNKPYINEGASLQKDLQFGRLRYGAVCRLHTIILLIHTSIILTFRRANLWPHTPSIEEYCLLERFGETCRLHLHGRRIIWVELATSFHAGIFLGLFFRHADGENTFLRNVSWLSTDYTALYPIR